MVPLPGADDALLRWKLGHHMFHQELAAMNTLLAAAREQLDSRSWPELENSLIRLSVLYHGATATMQYAADFSSELYEQLIRPSMAPPFTSPGFSGTLNLEHTLMITQLGGLFRLINDVECSDCAQEVLNAAARLWDAQSRNRDHHILICKRFVPDGESMLTAFFRAQSPAAAVSQTSEKEKEARQR